MPSDRIKARAMEQSRDQIPASEEKTYHDQPTSIGVQTIRTGRVLPKYSEAAAIAAVESIQMNQALNRLDDWKRDAKSAKNLGVTLILRDRVITPREGSLYAYRKPGIKITRKRKRYHVFDLT